MRAPNAATIRNKLFGYLDPRGVYIAQAANLISVNLYADDGIDVLRRFGSNRPTRPVRVGTMWSYRDTVTPLLNNNPFFKTRVAQRIWQPNASQTDAGRLAEAARHILAEAATHAGYGALEAGFIDGGPQFSPASFQTMVIEAAKRIGIWPAWTHQELTGFLDRASLLGRMKGIDITNRRAMAALMDRMVAVEKEGRDVFRHKAV